MKTILLNPLTWDLTLDVDRNIAVAADPYSIAQDVGSACKLYLGELWYNTNQGVPYYQSFLGRPPAPSALKASMVTAALTVPGVVGAVCFLQSVQNRAVKAQVLVTLQTGQTIAVPVRVTITPTAPSSGVSGLDFSNPDNSQYLPGLTGF